MRSASSENAIVIGGNTAIGEGVAFAQSELQSARHLPAHTRAMIVLSDGQNNAGRDPLAAANSAKATGTLIFAIGLSADADANLMRQIASQPANYYYAPTPDKLAEIYRTIAGEIRCRP